MTLTIWLVTRRVLPHWEPGATGSTAGRESSSSSGQNNLAADAADRWASLPARELEKAAAVCA